MRNYTKPNIDDLKSDLQLVEKTAMEKQAGGWPQAIMMIAGGLLHAGASTLSAVKDVAKESLGFAAAGAVSTGIAGAYLAHKMKQLQPSDINKYRTDFYKYDLKRRIKEIRKQQILDEKDRANKEQEPAKPSLRLG